MPWEASVRSIRIRRMKVVLFLIDVVFFFLVACFLLRAWMNGMRVSLAQQPGTFVMAVSNWCVMPLRRLLPLAVQRSRWDVASLLGACLLCLVQAALLLALGAAWASSSQALTAGWGSLPVVALQLLIWTALNGLLWITIAYALISWLQPHAPVQPTFSRLLSPLLAPLQKRIPRVGGVDLSALVLVLALQVMLMLIG